MMNDDATWESYYDAIHLYRLGCGDEEPMRPWQYGAHIKSLPIENNLRPRTAHRELVVIRREEE
jgi:hypothetical protein